MSFALRLFAGVYPTATGKKSRAARAPARLGTTRPLRRGSTVRARAGENGASPGSQGEEQNDGSILFRFTDDNDVDPVPASAARSPTTVSSSAAVAGTGVADQAPGRQGRKSRKNVSQEARARSLMVGLKPKEQKKEEEVEDDIETKEEEPPAATEPVAAVDEVEEVKPAPAEKAEEKEAPGSPPPTPASEPSDPAPDDDLTAAAARWISVLPPKGREKLVGALSKTETEEEEWIVLIASAKADKTKVRAKDKEILLDAAKVAGYNIE